jgi:hypothetical protein
MHAGWLVSIMTLLAKGILLEVIKECMKNYAGDGSSLADLRPTGEVASYCRSVGIEV